MCKYVLYDIDRSWRYCYGNHSEDNWLHSGSVTVTICSKHLPQRLHPGSKSKNHSRAEKFDVKRKGAI